MKTFRVFEGSRVAAAVVMAAVLTGFAPASSAEDTPCATALSVPAIPLSVSATELAQAWEPPRRAPMTITIVPGAGLSGNAAALAAFNRAADQWEARLTDPILVTIAADLIDLGSPTTIGSTSNVLLATSYTGLRDAMVADATDEADDGISASLPTAAQIVWTVAAGDGTNGSLAASKANFKALGFGGLDAMFGATDGTINFNSIFSFDYDNSNGVGAGQVDFETVAAHEIGHLLGFVSVVDVYDNLGAVSPAPYSLDLYRFGRLANNPATTANFTSFARQLAPGTDTITDDLTTEGRMSTGFNGGDGRQASHWKDDALTGVNLGNMDPTLANQVVTPVNALDARALDLIGYETNFCGNGAIGLGEACDDGNQNSGDCCSPLCQFELAGTGCTADANGCTNDVCNASGGCTHPNNTASCNDSIFCNGTDTCSGGSCSGHSGNPCSLGGECADSCNEAADNCFDLVGIGCSTDGNACTTDACNGSGTCAHNPLTGTSCTDGLFCNGTDTCNGGVCTTHAGDPCTGGGQCQNVCNEAGDTCNATAGTACDDGLFCNGADTCNAVQACANHAGDPCLAGGICNNSCNEGVDDCATAAGTMCTDDLDICTTDACDGGGTCAHDYDVGADPSCDICPPEPIAGCRGAGKTSMKIGDNATDNTKDSLQWKWLLGDATLQTDLGAPDTDAIYHLCVYVSGTAGNFMSLTVPSSVLWVNKDPKGWMFKDKTAVSDGVTQVKLGAGIDGKVKQQWKAKGSNLTLPAAATTATYFNPGGTVVVQAVGNDGQCWTSAFPVDSMSSNTAAKVSAASGGQVCGDFVIDIPEECDGTDDTLCSGLCDSSCACP